MHLQQIQHVMGQQPTRYKKVLVAFLYFIQGIFLGLPGTITLTYKQIPSYQILALFSLAYIPFSIKFISAPLVEKYSIASYGRRKTWITISLVLASLFLIISANFTNEDVHSQKILATFFTIVIFMISIEDICTDSLAVKQLNSAELASYMQCVMQPIGGVVGSLVFLQLVSQSLASKLDLNAPIMTVSQFFYALAFLTFTSATLIHFTYRQKEQEEQKDAPEHSLWQVIKHYKFFFHPQYRLCRQGLQLLLTNHGIIYFNASFTVELIKNNVISKDLLTSFQNFMIIPVFFLAGFLRKYWNSLDLVHKRTRVVMTIRLSIMMFLFFSEVKSQVVIIFLLMILNLMSNTQFFLNSMICNNFSQSKYAGMFVTMMASFINFGHNAAIHNEVINYFGQRIAVIFGFCYSIFVIIIFGYVQKWIKNGKNYQQKLSIKQGKNE